MTETKKRKKPSEGAMAPVDILGEQRLDETQQELVKEAYARLEAWEKDCQVYHASATKCRQVYRLNDPEQDLPGTPPARRAIQLQTLKSTINNCVADQMDNTPEALMLPERPEVESLATEMTDVVRFILDQNGYETYHRRRVEDFFIAGTAVTQVSWDKDMDNGDGNVSVLRIPVENMVWDPESEDIQDARALIKCSWHPLSWYADHYPEAAPYIHDEANEHQNVGRPESVQNVVSPSEGRAMLLEYWYRRYDSRKRRYTINVAYLAGGALLDQFEDAYAHGKYPFVFDAFTQIPGQPVGEGMVFELTPMMRYINRYAQYIDENLRYNCKSRMLIRKGSNIDTKQLSDWNQNLVEGDAIDEDNVRWFDTKPLNGMVSNQMLQFQNDMKMDSGQNQFSRGEVSGGVTAATAISALQEAGGKITRMRTAILSAGMKKIVEQVLWLVAEFYTEDRERLIIGEDQERRTIHLNAKHLMNTDRKAGGLLPPPPYVVQIQIQRRNPLRVAAQNDLMIQAYTMAAQSGQNFPLSTLFELLVVDGKDRVLPKLREMEQQQMMMAALQEQNAQLQQQNEGLQTSLDSYANSLGEDTSALQDASFGGEGETT